MCQMSMLYTWKVHNVLYQFYLKKKKTVIVLPVFPLSSLSIWFSFNRQSMFKNNFFLKQFLLDNFNIWNFTGLFCPVLFLLVFTHGTEFTRVCVHCSFITVSSAFSLRNYLRELLEAKDESVLLWDVHLLLPDSWR